MNPVNVLGLGLGHYSLELAREPRHRKATRNMLLAQTATEKALASVNTADWEPGSLGLVLGSSHGELEMTLNFLKTLAQTGVARPLLFQNSLHNSTTGFVAMHRQITGPMLTVSNLHFTGEDALETAQLLLNENQCKYCLVIGVDTCFPDLGTELPLTELNVPGLGEGAGAVLLAHSEAPINRSKRIGQLLEVGRESVKSASPVSLVGRYDSDAIAHWVRALESSSTGNRLSLAKVDGASSWIQWQR